MNLPTIPWKAIGTALGRHAPSILTGVGIGGFITATVMAVRETPKYYEERTAAGEEKLPIKDEALLVGKHYWPAAIVVGTSAACVLLANRMNLQRQAALAAACSVSETMLKNYKAKVTEVLGPKEEQKQISHAINEEYVKSRKDEILSDRGLYPIEMQIIIDKYSGTKFYMTVEDIRQIVNEFNARLIDEDILPYADLWSMMYEMAANKKQIYEPNCIYAVGFKFNGQKALVSASFDNVVVDNQPVTIVSFRPEPAADPWHKIY